MMSREAQTSFVSATFSKSLGGFPKLSLPWSLHPTSHALINTCGTDQACTPLISKYQWLEVGLIGQNFISAASIYYH